MYYTVYKITNTINGKFYIGKHQTKNLNDAYFGSGKILKRAIKKHSIENFTKEILEIYDSEAKMNLAEKILVVLDQDISYNLCDGGHGGFSFINKMGLNGLKNLSEENKHKASLLGGAAARNKTIERNKASKGITKNTSHINTPEVIEKRNNTLKEIGHQQGPKNSQFGKPRSEETKRKISETLKKRKI